jgi:predicted nucleotide-binding protein (sugar kinase/HSP70/actin superfamily)
MVQGNQYMIKAALGLEENEILSPTVHLAYGPDLLSMELHSHLGRRLGKSRRQIRAALDIAFARQQDFENELYSHGARAIASLGQKEPLVLVTGRSYNLFDERLNLRLGQNLAKIGLTALPTDLINIRDVDLSDFPNMYWAYGYQVLQAAKLIKLTPNFFGLHLTNFSCGPDSFNEHFYKYIMGDKPYLILELDEHSAVAGVMTRLEAFKNVILSVQKMESIKSETTRATAVGN